MTIVKGEGEPGLIYAPYIWAQCVDKDMNHLNSQAWIPSESVYELCIYDEDNEMFLYVVPDDELKNYKTSSEPIPSK